MSSNGENQKSIHAALISHNNDKLKELLLELKFVLKDNAGDIKMISPLGKDYDFRDDDAESILSYDDVKVRQFGAFCIAGLMGERSSGKIVSAYLNEDVDYVKEHYVKALSGLTKISGEERLYERLDELETLLKQEKTESHKHYVKEIRLLLGLLRTTGGKRVFTGHKVKSEIILTTNRNFREITLSEIRKFPKKTFNAGVMTICDDTDKIKNIRTYEEMLFVPPFDEERYGNLWCDKDIARIYVKDILTPYILERMIVAEGDKRLPISFRLDIKGESVREKEEQIQRTLTEIVEEESGYGLINVRNDFDIQVRFVKRKTGVFKPLVKFCSPRDDRFSYKISDIAAGIKPYLASLICNLCSEYMSENSRVIDPFCGAGTLLVERDKLLKTEFLFGSDIYPAACAAAEKNLSKAGLTGRSKIINKDFLSLEHKEPFTEMITDLPFETEKKSEKDLEGIYSAFFGRAERLLCKDSYLFVYTRNSTLFKKQILKNKITMIKCFEISKREGAYLFVLKL
ncbi:MAG: methyltransferase [Lachnospiraceae bacterium]|nr:methyltransferase [Lachnospiraceae bacterium]